MWGAIAGIVGALLAGAFGSWFYFVKIRGRIARAEGQASIKNSEDSDSDREDVQSAIEEQIRKNKELQDELRRKLEDGE
jgi:hypothetical protein